MLDKLKHGYNKVKDVLEDISYNIPAGLWFIIKCSVITIIWITIIC